MSGGYGGWNPVSPGGSGGPTVDTQTGTTYTVVAGDDGKVIRFTNAGTVTVTLPAGLSAGTLVHLVFEGAGGGVVQGDGTSTVTGGGTVDEDGEASCLVTSTDTWDVQTTTPTVTTEAVAGTSYTVLAADSGKIKRFTDASAVTVTLPDGIDVGSVVELLAWGAGGVTIQGNGTSTVNQTGSIAQYEAASCVVVAANTWSVVGPLT